MIRRGGSTGLAAYPGAGRIDPAEFGRRRASGGEERIGPGGGDGAVARKGRWADERVKREKRIDESSPGIKQKISAQTLALTWETGRSGR